MVLAFFLSAAWATAAASWHRPLSLDGQGYWPEREPVTLRNESDRAVAGEPVEIAIPALAGAPVESLRACRADGVELLFDLRDARGRARRSGLLAGDDRLVLPAECPANGTAALPAGRLLPGQPMAGIAALRRPVLGRLAAEFKAAIGELTPKEIGHGPGLPVAGIDIEGGRAIGGALSGQNQPVVRGEQPVAPDPAPGIAQVEKQFHPIGTAGA